MSEILFQSATEAAAMLRQRDISSRELTELVLARIDAVNLAVNAIVEQQHDRALAAADQADKALAQGEVVGPLHGVPVTVKESFNVAGLQTTWGNPAFAGFTADWDATVVRRLRQAGAIIAGKSNVHLMLADFAQTENPVYGRTNNPWDLARTPGGSTGGGAAALAAGMTFLEYGSDLVGSIRIPASFCGVYGLKPSTGLVPARGFQPPGLPALPSDAGYMTAIGPLARSAADLRTALAATAGPEEPAANGYSWHLSPPRHDRLADYRVGVVLDDPHCRVSSDVGAVLSDAVDALAKAGVTITEGWPSQVDPAGQAESFGFQVNLFFAHNQGDTGFATLAEVVEQESRRMMSRAAWTRYFEDVDVFLCPVDFTSAFPHDARPFPERVIATPEGERRYDDQVFWIAQPSLPGLPVAAAPTGLTAGGLPVGAQFVGPLYEDDTVITFAELAAEVTGGFTPSPGDW